MSPNTPSSNSNSQQCLGGLPSPLSFSVGRLFIVRGWFFLCFEKLIGWVPLNFSFSWLNNRKVFILSLFSFCWHYFISIHSFSSEILLKNIFKLSFSTISNLKLWLLPFSVSFISRKFPFSSDRIFHVWILSRRFNFVINFTANNTSHHDHFSHCQLHLFPSVLPVMATVNLTRER